MNARARKSDPGTSYAAASTVNWGRHRKLVYEYLRWKAGLKWPASEFTREELADALSGLASPQSARSRLTELRRDGFVRTSVTAESKTRLGRSQQVLSPGKNVPPGKKPKWIKPSSPTGKKRLHNDTYTLIQNPNETYIQGPGMPDPETYMNTYGANPLVTMTHEQLRDLLEEVRNTP